MRLKKREILSCLLVVSLCMIVGCGKEGDEQTPGGTGGAETQAASVDMEKPVSEIQAEAGTMTVDGLKATAMKYKEAVLAKQGELEKLAARIKEIPIAEALGEEAKTLKTDLANLQSSLTALKDRFQVYHDTLKEKGGDVTGLAL